jgi:hypothetical protein
MFLRLFLKNSKYTFFCNVKKAKVLKVLDKNEKMLITVFFEAFTSFQFNSAMAVDHNSLLLHLCIFAYLFSFELH